MHYVQLNKFISLKNNIINYNVYILYEIFIIFNDLADDLTNKNKTHVFLKIKELLSYSDRVMFNS